MYTQAQKNRYIKAETKRIFQLIEDAEQIWLDARAPWVEKAVAKWGPGWASNWRHRAYVSAPTYLARSRFFRKQRALYKEMSHIIDSIVDGTYIPPADNVSNTNKAIITVTKWRRKGIWRVAEEGTWPDWCSEVNIALWKNKTQRFVVKGCTARKGQTLPVTLNGRACTFEAYPGSRWVRHRSITSEAELRTWIPEAV